MQNLIVDPIHLALQKSFERGWIVSMEYTVASIFDEFLNISVLSVTICYANLSTAVNLLEMRTKQGQI